MRAIWRKGGTFRTFFWSLFALCMAMLIMNQGLACRRELYDVSSKWDVQEAEDAFTFAARIDSCLTDISVLAVRLQETSWVQKLYYQTESFESEFSLKRRQEIIQNFVFYQQESSLLNAMFLVFPFRNLCIAQGVWTDKETYFDREYPGCDAEALLEQIQSTRALGALYDAMPQAILFCIPIDKSATPRAYLCVKASVSRWQSTLEMGRPATINGMRIVEKDSEQVVFETKTHAAQESRTVRLNSRLGSWVYDVAIDGSTRKAAQGAAYFRMICTILLLAPLAFLASWALANALYRPLRQLLCHMNLENVEAVAKQTDFQHIGDSYDKIVGEYRTLMRERLLTKLLYGAACSAEELRKNGICFEDGMLFQTYLMPEEAEASEGAAHYAAIREGLSQLRDVRYEFIEAHNGMLALVLAFSVEDSTRQTNARILEMLKERCPTLIAGNIRPGLEGIAASWQYAVEKYDQLHTAARRFYPLDWKIRFLRALQSGGDDAQVVLRCLRAENDQRLEVGAIENDEYRRLFSELIDDVTLVITDARPEKSDALDRLRDAFENCDTAEIWVELERIVRLVCEGDSQEDLLKYLRENCCDATLNQNALADTFHISVGTLCKRIKEVTGESYLNYLTGLRMERARMLLRQRDLSVSSIAQMCGYDSDVSFRRAFIRCAGVRPQEYREQFGMGKCVDREENLS